MIYLISGETGSGKTFLCVKFVYKRWLKGADIYSKIELQFFPKDKKTGKNLINRSFTVFEYPEFFRRKEKLFFIMRYYFLKIFRKKAKILSRGNIYYIYDLSDCLGIKDGVILFDDAGDILDAYNWDSVLPEFRQKLRIHRHHNLDLYSTIPSIKQIDVNYRRLVHKWYIVKKLFAIRYKKKEFYGVHQAFLMDVEKAYQELDSTEKDVKYKRSRIFLIHKLKKRLYHSEDDIPYRRTKLIWLSSLNLLTRKSTRDLKIVPKK